MAVDLRLSHFVYNDAMQRFYRWIFLALLIFGCACLAAPCPVLARAGGGHSYSGGGSSGGGSFGGGHGFGGGGGVHFGGSSTHSPTDMGLNPTFCIVILIIVFLALLYKVFYLQRLPVEQVITAAAPVVSMAAEESCVLTLRKADPSFDSQAFYRRVAGAFHLIQEAWSRQDLTSIRPFVSDGLYERFVLQIQEQRDLGYRNVMDAVRVHAVVIQDVSSDQHFDTVIVRITASARDFDVMLATGQPRDTVERPENFVEYWSFLRRRGAASRQAGLMEGNCPNCGAAVEINQSTACAHCHAILRSGAFDWVLVEITQESEFARGESRMVPGLAAVQAADPTFSLAHLEDRASVIFWRRVMAERLGRVDPLRKVALREFADHWSRAQSVSPPRWYLGDCGVGAVRTHRFLLDADRQRALVEIDWSGTYFTADAQGHVTRGQQGDVIRSLYVLMRKKGASSNLDFAVSSSHCPHCGGPETDLAADACEFCRSLLNDGSYDWVISDILTMASPEAKSLLSAAESPAAEAAAPPAAGDADLAALRGVPMLSSRQLLGWMVKAAWADGQISEPERQLLETAAARRGICPEQLTQMLSAHRAGLLDVAEPASRDEAKAWLAAMIAVALADGTLQTQERILLKTTAQTYGFSAYDLQLLIVQQRKKLLQTTLSAWRPC